MDLLKNISPIIYLIVSLTLITIGILILFLGKFIFAIISFVMGLISLVAWTFFGLFDESKDA
tara:strand:+ start:582 stop:767 length:186 start_codon:yes stop_codon:yes gene_type:complete